MIFARLGAAAVCVAATGCATTTADFDTHAVESNAKILRKEVVTYLQRNTAEVRPFIPVPIGPFIVVLRPGTGVGKIPVYLYEVETKDKKVHRIFNEAGMFEIGMCVNLFQSAKPTYPRIAFGGTCDW